MNQSTFNITRQQTKEDSALPSRPHFHQDVIRASKRRPRALRENALEREKARQQRCVSR